MNWAPPLIAALGEPYRLLDDTGKTVNTVRWLQSAYSGSGGYVDSSGKVCEKEFFAAKRAVERLAAGEIVESSEPQAKLQFGEKR